MVGKGGKISLRILLTFFFFLFCRNGFLDFGSLEFGNGNQRVSESGLGEWVSFFENVANVLFSFFFVGTASWNHWIPGSLLVGKLGFGMVEVSLRTFLTFFFFLFCRNNFLDFGLYVELS